jgi:hypothetical protein
MGKYGFGWTERHGLNNVALSDCPAHYYKLRGGLLLREGGYK